MSEPHVDSLWYGLQPLVTGLQSAGRLPATGQLFDAHLELVKEYLRRDDRRALAEAAGIAARNPGAGFLAFQLIQSYCSAIGDHERARIAASHAMDELAKAERELDRQRKPRRWWQR